MRNVSSRWPRISAAQWRSPFALAFALTVGVLIVELVGGVAAHSLALLSDAGHVITDVFALGLGWFAAAQATRSPTVRNTFGFHRMGIITAFINATTLVGLAIFIAIEAVSRLRHPQPVNPSIMIAAALVGIAINVVIARFLGGHTHSHDRANLNTRAALLHVISDIGASAGVIVGAIAIALTGQPLIDTAVSVAIAVVLTIGAIRIGRSALYVLLEAAPADIDIEQIKRSLVTIEGIHDVHHVHLWSIDNTRRSLSCHVIIDDMAISHSTPILERITDRLRGGFAIDHATIQFEQHQHTTACPCDRDVGCECSLDPAVTLAPAASGHRH